MLEHGSHEDIAILLFNNVVLQESDSHKTSHRHLGVQLMLGHCFEVSWFFFSRKTILDFRLNFLEFGTAVPFESVKAAGSFVWKPQVEHYFSDSNWGKDEYLRSLADAEGFVPITGIMDFKPLDPKPLGSCGVRLSEGI